jgi:hypothetical protein
MRKNFHLSTLKAIQRRKWESFGSPLICSPKWLLIGLRGQFLIDWCERGPFGEGIAFDVDR